MRTFTITINGTEYTGTVNILSLMNYSDAIGIDNPDDALAAIIEPVLPGEGKVVKLPTKYYRDMGAFVHACIMETHRGKAAPAITTDDCILSISEISAEQSKALYQAIFNTTPQPGDGPEPVADVQGDEEKNAIAAPLPGGN